MKLHAITLRGLLSGRTPGAGARLTFSRVVLRGLRHHWKTGAAVAFGVAVATAVIVGSLLVGDSVTGSVRDVALSRLGQIDYALVSPGLFRESLAEDIAGHRDLAGRLSRVVPVALRQGAVTSLRDEDGATAPNVNIVGVDDPFWGLFSTQTELSLRRREAVVNAALARDLEIGERDEVYVRIGRRGALPANTLFGHRDRTHTVARLRLTVVAVVPDDEGGAFSLELGTAAPRNLFVSRAWLARELSAKMFGQQGPREDVANAILVESAPHAVGRNDARLQAALEAACTVKDRGLRLVQNERYNLLVVESQRLLLTESQVAAALEAARECSGRAGRTSIYLADTIRRKQTPSASTAYAVVCGLEPLEPFPLERGWPLGTSSEYVLLNRWATDDLLARVGDPLEITYLVPRRDGEYEEKTVRRVLRGVVKMGGHARDRRLVPEFPGITDAPTINQWDLPFTLKHAVSKSEHEYWAKHGPTPKAFVTLATVRSMWRDGGSTDWITSVRIAPPEGEGLAAFGDRFLAALSPRLSPGDSGLAFRPIRRLAIEGSKGSTDFGLLFLAMSVFLVCSGLGLAGMLMRLSVERRAGELGTLLACGFDGRTAGRLVFAEGAILAVVGAVLGVPAGVLYAAGIVHALRTWWTGAVGTGALWLHVGVKSPLIGLAAGLGAGLLSVWWGIRQMRGRRVLELLGGWRARAAPGPGRIAHAVPLAVAVVCLGVAGALAALSAWLGVVSPAAAFYGSGAALLVGGLAVCHVALVRALARRGRPISMASLALRNAASHRGRSMLAIGLVACAAFVIVTVAANERDLARTDVRDQASGAGGFTLRAVSSVPLHYDFGTRAGRKKLGFKAEDEGALADIQVVSFFLSPGQDISCLNLAKPDAPRVLGVSREMMERGGFTIKTLGDGGEETPWRLLDRAGEPAAAFGDSETVMWQLFSGRHSGLGRTFPIPDETGRPAEVEFVGLIRSSILASELLTSQANFHRMFPSEKAPRYFLIETPPGAEATVARVLRKRLGKHGLEVRTTREILSKLAGVQNTYLMTFLALGGLGVLLGTVGLVVVLLRSALERRAEFALMLASGFGRPSLAGLLVVENAGLLAAGLVCGAVAALAAVAPQLASVESSVNWAALAGLLAGIMVIGLASCGAAAAATVRGELIPALRSE